MSQPFIGEIRMFAGNFAPVGWMLCQGQTISISENETLFNVIGTTYGGDGQETFALPNLASRVPVHNGSTFQIGEAGGTESVTLTTQQIPVHNHTFLTLDGTASNPNPGQNLLAKSTQADFYFADSPSIPMNPQSIPPVGGSQPHDNMMPYLVVSFIISLYGIYPPPN